MQPVLQPSLVSKIMVSKIMVSKIMVPMNGMNTFFGRLS